MSQAGILNVINSNPDIPIDFNGNTGTATAIFNVINILGNLSQGVSTAAGSNTITITVADTTTVSKGVAQFNPAQFTVAAGIVSLIGGGAAIDSIAVQTGTSPIVPDGTGLVTINGAVVAAGTNPIRSNGTGANTMAMEVQISQAIASTNATNIGLSAFNSAHFSVDANGFVSLAGGGLAIDSVQVDASTAPGTNPVAPTVAGLITVTGGQVATGTIGANVIRTNSLAANTYTIQIQRSTSAAATDITLNGVSHFNSNQFTVDANGFVSLAGAGLAVDSFAMQTGTSPVVPAATGLVTFNGAVVAAGTNPVRTNGTGANTMALEIQITQAIASTNATNIGLAAFNSAHFSVDANGFVSLSGGGLAIDSIQVDAFTGPGTNPVAPTGAGLITVTGAQVAAGTIGANVIRTNSLAASTYTIQIQRSTTNATSDSTKNGVSHYDSTSFAVDSNGFVQLNGAGFTWTDVSGAFSPLKNNGYFITGTATGTLPAAPAQGDTIKFFVDHASQVLTIQATAGKIIRMGSLVSSSGGTFVSTLQGDSCELVYRSSNSCWCAVAGFTGTWTLT